MAFPPGFLDELRARVPLGSLVGRRVKLIRRGRELGGLCPFHHEKTPSFYVVEDKGFFHCFGCGAHGDAIGFLMRADNLDFIEAVERLAGEAGIAVPQQTPQDRDREQRQKTLLEALAAAADFYEAQLWSPSGARAREYLTARGLDEETIRRFRLGWAGDDRQALHRALGGDFPDPLLHEGGLLRTPEPVLCFDGDSAGQRAARRALDRALPLLQPGRSLRFASLPSGEDPDSLIRGGGPAAFVEVLASAQPLSEKLWRDELSARA